jgi:hypothetical protein
LRDLPLEDDRSQARNPDGSRFSAAEIAGLEERARGLNRTGDDDPVAVYLIAVAGTPGGGPGDRR